MKIDATKLPGGVRIRMIILGAAFVGICLPAVLDMKALETPRRILSISQFRNSVGPPTEYLPEWARTGLVTNTETPDPESETAVFWHIPQSGGATVKHTYECMGRSIANRLGVLERFGHGEEDELIEFEPFKEKDWKTVNVDVTTSEGILRAAELDLAGSDKVDLIITPEASFLGKHVFKPQHKGRYMGMFRHPVERLISKFYFLRTADWIPTYRPELKETSLTAWASTRVGNMDENFLVRKLNAKTFADPIDRSDLETAQQLLKHMFIVGLSDEMEESVRRFNVVMGLIENEIDPEFDERIRGCMEDLHEKVESFKEHESDHPKIGEDHAAWQILAERNSLDMELYEYIQDLFVEQEDVIKEFEKRTREKLVIRKVRKEFRYKVLQNANAVGGSF